MILNTYNSGEAIIEFYFDKYLDGMLVTKVDLTTFSAKKAWLKFLNKYKSYTIFMSPTNIEIIKNHIKFFGTFGTLKVYRYARR